MNNEEVKIPADCSKHLEIIHYFGEHWAEVAVLKLNIVCKNHLERVLKYKSLGASQRDSDYIWVRLGN